MSSLRNSFYRIARDPRLTRDFHMDIALGRVPGASPDFVAGVASPVNSSDGEVTIMDLVPRRMVFPTGLVDIFITSTDAGDTTQSVSILGLTEDFTPIISEVQLNGQTPVQLPDQMRHVQTARLVGGTPVGNVYVSRTSNSALGIPNNLDDVLSYIIAGKNITRNGWYRVPKGMSGLPVAIRGNTDSPDKPAEINTYITFDGDIPLQTVSYSVSTTFPQLLFPVPVGVNTLLGSTVRVLPEGSLIEFTANVNTNGTVVFFGIDVVLFRDGEFGNQPLG